MTLRILVFGGSGQVGSALSSLGCQGLEIIPMQRSDADLCDPNLCATVIEGSSAHVVVNAAGFTDVDRAEQNPDTARLINAIAPGKLAEAARANGKPFLHLSTNLVFDGSGNTPWVEQDIARSLSVYGTSKHIGDLAVLRAGGQTAVLRTSWIYSPGGNNFCTAMQNAAAGNRPVHIVNDHWGGPTPARSVANALVIMARAFVAGRGHTGLFHFQGTPCVTWFGFANAIFARSGIRNLPALIPISSSEDHASAIRPANGRLDCTRIARRFGIRQPNWRDELTEMSLTPEEALT